MKRDTDRQTAIEREGERDDSLTPLPTPAPVLETFPLLARPAEGSMLKSPSELVGVEGSCSGGVTFSSLPSPGLVLAEPSLERVGLGVLLEEEKVGTSAFFRLGAFEALMLLTRGIARDKHDVNQEERARVGVYVCVCACVCLYSPDGIRRRTANLNN